MTDDHTLAAAVATEAGDALLDLRARLVGRGAPATTLRREGDQTAHRLILERLAAARPDDPVLSEEGDPLLDRADEGRLWIVDPLDGTREYGEPPRADWAVHVALVVGATPAAGAVALPADGLTLATRPPPPPPPPRTAAPRLAVSRTRPPAFAAELAIALGAELVPLGSAGAKAMAVVRGAADVYAHAGGQHVWDSAAPVAVAAAAGLHVSRLDGSPLSYAGHDPSLPDLLVCRPELAEAVLTAVNG